MTMHFSSVVAIANLAAAKLGPVNAAPRRRHFDCPTASPNLSGEILFNDQCLLDLVHGPGGTEPGPLPFGSLLPALMIVTSDDLGFSDNQCDCSCRRSRCWSRTCVRPVIGARRRQPLQRTLTRRCLGLPLGILNMTVNSQADHCIVTFNWRLQAQPDLITVHPNFCAFATEPRLMMRSL
jgi:hypothetical protein